MVLSENDKNLGDDVERCRIWGSGLRYLGSAKEGVKSVPGSFNPSKWGVDSSATMIDQTKE